jgi:hypothetical protein
VRQRPACGPGCAAGERRQTFGPGGVALDAACNNLELADLLERHSAQHGAVDRDAQVLRTATSPSIGERATRNCSSSMYSPQAIVSLRTLA